MCDVTTPHGHGHSRAVPSGRKTKCEGLRDAFKPRSLSPLSAAARESGRACHKLQKLSDATPLIMMSEQHGDGDASAGDGHLW